VSAPAERSVVGHQLAFGTVAGEPHDDHSARLHAGDDPLAKGGVDQIIAQAKGRSGCAPRRGGSAPRPGGGPTREQRIARPGASHPRCPVGGGGGRPPASVRGAAPGPGPPPPPAGGSPQEGGGTPEARAPKSRPAGAPGKKTPRLAPGPPPEKTAPPPRGP